MKNTSVNARWMRMIDRARMKTEEKKVEYLELIYDLILSILDDLPIQPSTGNTASKREESR